ncbi:MAG: amino acid permease [Candidatus Delongbacteria bacterium]|nr:amino acid permease [Candidatus Delongbacteria bacterium]MDD4205314.1 amino acid permease [Candidatus Delongbacteria bacterium]
MMVKKHLKKNLGLLEVFSISSGAMISSGLFVLPGIAYLTAGPCMIVSYFIAGVLALFGILSQAELVSAMPKAGGDYFYITRSMGPAVGTINGLIVWFSISLKSAFALIGMATLVNLVTEIDIGMTAAAFTVVFVMINSMGSKEAGAFQVWTVVVLILILVIYIFYGMGKVEIENLSPFIPNGKMSILATAGLVYISYGGLLKLSSVAEETVNPAKTIPIGMISSLAVVGVLYALVIFVTVGVIGTALGTDISNVSLTPVSDAARSIMGTPGKIALSVAALLAFISTANAGVMSASRYLLALSRDKLLPDVFGTCHKKSGAPVFSVAFTGLIISIFVFIDLKLLIKTASTVLIGTSILSSIAVIVLKESRIQNYQPKFKSPFYPWTQIIGITGFIFLLFEMGIEAILISAALSVLGFLVYWFFGKKNAEQEYAILHLIERITSREFVTYDLENELKDIIRERDDIVKDRFDHIIEKCTVVNINEKMSFRELFRIVSFHIHNKMGIEQDQAQYLLMSREKESSTVLSDFIAIPHIIASGSGKFDIFLFRGRKGFEFDEKHEKVKAVFVLVGTKDERNFHLRAISAIAQIVKDPEFENRWDTAKTVENLRDVVLLSKRVR